MVGANAETIKKIEQEVREQELVIRGYEIENKRLISELKDMQTKAKDSEHKMFSENQRLEQQVFALQNKLSLGELDNKSRSRMLDLERELDRTKDSLLERELELK